MLIESGSNETYEWFHMFWDVLDAFVKQTPLFRREEPGFLQPANEAAAL